MIYCVNRLRCMTLFHRRKGTECGLLQPKLLQGSKSGRFSSRLTWTLFPYALQLEHHIPVLFVAIPNRLDT